MTEALRIVDVDRVDCRLVAHQWEFARARAADIDRHWAERRRENPSLYDGPVLLACSAELVTQEGARTLLLDAFETRFSRFLAWRDFGWPDESVYNCFSMPAVRSSDGAYLVGEMGADHSCAGQLYFPGGTPDPSDVTEEGAVDLTGSLIRELAEETGLPGGEGVAAPGWTIVFDRQRVACLKRIDWPASASALATRARRFLAAEDRPELADVHMVSGGEFLDDSRLPAFMVGFLSRAFGLAERG